MLPESPNRPSPLLIACLCANWCGTCRDYQPLFIELQQRFPNAMFVWIDVEDEAELVDPIEVENFPTVLIATPTQARFFGTITPHIETLHRLVLSHNAHNTPALSSQPELNALAQRLWQRAEATALRS